MRTVLPYLSWLVLLVGVAVAGENYPAYPPVWPSHWDAHNVANGWTQKSWGGVLLPFGLGFVVCALLEGLAQLSRWMAKPDAELEQEILRVISLALALFLAYLGVAIPHGHGVALTFPLTSLLLLGGVYPTVRMCQRISEMHRSGQLPKGYRYRGAIYNNADDPRVWVPKLVGIGYTLNFAHKASWVWMAVLVGGPLLALAFILAQN